MDSGRIRLSITDRRSKNPRARSNPQSAGGVTRRPHGTIAPCGAYATRLVHYPDRAHAFNRFRHFRHFPHKAGA